MKALRLLAGKTALAQIKARGLKPEFFTRMLAASGGPKWIGIAALDKYLFGEFFKDRQAPLHTLGSSSGAWRLACFAQQDRIGAYERLEESYIGQRYDTKPSPDEVSRQVSSIVSHILGAHGAHEIAANAVIRSHFVVCRGKHINGLPGKLPLSLGLSMTAATNLFSRRSLGWHFERMVFSQQDRHSHFRGLNDLPTQEARLTAHNLPQVLQASGTIPLLIAPVKTIDGAKPGHFFDGGITDYHFDFDLGSHNGLTLYPHFGCDIRPGWFDKSLPWRRARANYHNALILAPTEQFVASLPGGKIPDRDDFRTLDTQSRQKNWYRVLEESERLADELHELLQRNHLPLEALPD